MHLVFKGALKCPGLLFYFLQSNVKCSQYRRLCDCMRGVAIGNSGWTIDVSTPLSAEDVPKIYALTPKCPTVDLLVTCL